MKCNDFASAESRSLPVLDAEKNVVGKLVPIGPWLLKDREKIQLMSEWRGRAMKNFFSQFESTYERTFNYLNDLSIGQSDRLLFVILDEGGQFVGHIGLSSVTGKAAELDNVMRGALDAKPGLMRLASLALLNWCFDQLAFSEVQLVVISSNIKALSLYQELNFEVLETIPLRKRDKNGEISHQHVERSSANVPYVCIRMILKKADFEQLQTETPS